MYSVYSCFQCVIQISRIPTTLGIHKYVVKEKTNTPYAETRRRRGRLNPSSSRRRRGRQRLLSSSSSSSVWSVCLETFTVAAGRSSVVCRACVAVCMFFRANCWCVCKRAGKRVNNECIEYCTMCVRCLRDCVICIRTYTHMHRCGRAVSTCVLLLATAAAVLCTSTSAACVRSHSAM